MVAKNNLSNEIVRLSKILEKQIPKGYHEIVMEYVRQNVVNIAYETTLLVVGIVILILSIKLLFKSFSDKENSALYYLGRATYGGESYQMSGLGIVVTIACFISLAVIVSLLITIPTAIQHAVAPNYYLIKSFIK